LQLGTEHADFCLINGLGFRKASGSAGYFRLLLNKVNLTVREY